MKIEKGIQITKRTRLTGSAALVELMVDGDSVLATSGQVQTLKKHIIRRGFNAVLRKEGDMVRVWMKGSN